MIDKTRKAKYDPKEEPHDLMALCVRALLSKPFLPYLFLKGLKWVCFNGSQRIQCFLTCL